MKRIFTLAGVEGSTDLLYAVVDVDGDPVSVNDLRHNPSDLRTHLGHLHVDLTLSQVEGRVRLQVEVATADTDEIETISRFLPYSLTDRVDRCSFYDERSTIGAAAQ